MAEWRQSFLGLITDTHTGETSMRGSDARIKENIKNLGKHPNLGVSIYSWTYKNDDDTRYVGVIAQDLLIKRICAPCLYS